MNRRGRPPYPDVLTPRQWEVLALLREGLSNEQIALRLGISVDGVKFHVSEILSKLGVSSRNEAARWEGQQRQAAPSACVRTSPPGPLSTSWREGVRKRKRGAGPRCHLRVRPSSLTAAAC
jgi:DNA-binding CsgD family transcriptional regulator